MPTLDEMLTVYSGKKRMRTQKTMQDIGDVLLGETVEDEERFTSKEKIALYIKLEELRNTRQKLAQAKATGDARASQKYQRRGAIDARTAATMVGHLVGTGDRRAKAKAKYWDKQADAAAKRLEEFEDFGELENTLLPKVREQIETIRLKTGTGGQAINEESAKLVVKFLNKHTGDDSNFYAIVNALDEAEASPGVNLYAGGMLEQFRAIAEKRAGAIQVEGVRELLANYDRTAALRAEAQAGIPALKAQEEAAVKEGASFGGMSPERYKELVDRFMGIGPDTTNEEIGLMMSQLGLGGTPGPSDYEMKILEELDGEGLTEQRDKIISSPEFAAWFKDSGYRDPLTAFKARLRERQQDIKAAKKHDKFYDQLKRMGYDDATAREFAKARMGEWQDRKDRFVPRPKDKPKLTASSLAAGVDAQGALEDKLKKRQVKKAERNQAKLLAREAEEEVKSLQAVNEDIEKKYREVFGLKLGGKGANAVLEGMSEEEIKPGDTAPVEPDPLMQKMIEARKARKLRETKEKSQSPRGLAHRETWATE